MAIYKQMTRLAEALTARPKPRRLQIPRNPTGNEYTNLAPGLLGITLVDDLFQSPFGENLHGHHPNRNTYNTVWYDPFAVTVPLWFIPASDCRMLYDLPTATGMAWIGCAANGLVTASSVSDTGLRLMGGIVFRASDSTHHWRVQATPVSTLLVRVNGLQIDSYTGLPGGATEPVNVSARFLADHITITVNGVQTHDIHDSYNQAAAMHGIYSPDRIAGNVRFTEFSFQI